MFVDAINMATAFTSPYVGLRRRANGEVFSTIGTFIVVNADGWILTSGHIVDEIQSCHGIEAGEASMETVAEEQRAGMVSEHLELWALPGFAESGLRLAEAHVNRIADIGLCRLDRFDPASVRRYPVFRDSARAPVEQGMSVCRLGFPFVEMPATFDESRGEFDLSSGSFPMPRFALDGMVSRFNRHFADDAASSALFIETSTPGLRGQSGGPLLDVEGRVCGIQSHTSHLDLGFDAQYFIEGEIVLERQFLNVGVATHVDEVRALLDRVGVSHLVA